MEIKTRVQGETVSVYFPKDVLQRLRKTVEQGTYLSAVVTACVRESLPAVEAAMKKQTTAKKSART